MTSARHWVAGLAVMLAAAACSPSPAPQPVPQRAPAKAEGTPRQDTVQRKTPERASIIVPPAERKAVVVPKPSEPGGEDTSVEAPPESEGPQRLVRPAPDRDED